MPPETDFAKLLRSLYCEGRDLIAKALADVDDDVASWPGLDPSGKISIRTLVVHIAGFDNLVQAALVGGNAATLVRDSAWQTRFGSGFPRELRVLDPAIVVPDTPPLDNGMAILAEQTEAMLALLDSELDLNAELAFPNDEDLFTTGKPQPVSAARLTLWVPMHDRYHRGHITHLKYDYRCLHSGRCCWP
ncbi:DinB family protein [Salinactinospora qingdaonensis]|uniref:DinB-like domain-containing protein n=1 Tax=Salinactinospora qingdaonensis TaxID=702744 RepID=A0ABP7G2P8_9ACTN